MQINDLFGRAAAFETARLPDGTAAVLPAEHAAALYVNEQPAFRVVCTPELLPQLALGRLLTEGWITSAQEVEQTAVCAEGMKVNVYLNHRLTARSAEAQTVSSCCTDNVTLSSPVELPPLRTVPQMELQPEWLDTLAAAMSAFIGCKMLKKQLPGTEVQLGEVQANWSEKEQKLKIHLVVDAEMTKAQLMDILKKADVI